MEVTIEEKRESIRHFCDSQGNCRLCPLFTKEYCDTCTEATADEATINEWFDDIRGCFLEDQEPTPILESEMITIDNTDNVNHPSHYENGKVECIDAMIETQGAGAVQSFCICNAFKYIWRHKNKNHLEDVKKAIWYLNKFVELEEKRQCTDTTIETNG